MKTRSGYVSNSSSTSFLVYGRDVVEWSKALKWIEEGKRVICVDEGTGTSGDSADFVFDLTPERYALMKGYENEIINADGFYVICADYSSCDYNEDGMDVELPDLEGGSFFEFQRDDNSAYTDKVNDKYFLEWLSGRMRYIEK